MVFVSEDERGWVVVGLSHLGAPADLLAWAADPATDLSILSTPEAVPFWDEVLVDLWFGTGDRPSVADDASVLDEHLFGLAAEAYLTCWRADHERSEMLAAADILARAARAHLAGRSLTAD